MLREMGVPLPVRPGASALPAAVPPSRLGRDVPRPEPALPVRAPAVALAAREETRSFAVPCPPALAAGTDAGPADWLVVGDPVDAAEGDAGGAAQPLQDQLLAGMLRAVRVSRSASGRGGRACFATAVLDEPAAATGVGALAGVVDAVRPRVIVALGRAAAQALLGVDESVGKLRGRVHDCRGVPVIASFALAYLLRHPHDKAKAWADLCLAVRALEGAAGG